MCTFYFVFVLFTEFLPTTADSHTLNPTEQTAEAEKPGSVPVLGLKYSKTACWITTGPEYFKDTGTKQFSHSHTAD